MGRRGWLHYSLFAGWLIFEKLEVPRRDPEEVRLEDIMERYRAKKGGIVNNSLLTSRSILYLFRPSRAKREWIDCAIRSIHITLMYAGLAEITDSVKTGKTGI